MKFFTTVKLSENIHETPEGYLVCIGVPIARTGNMIYMNGEIPLDADDDGKIVINRSEDEVFRPETIKSFEGKPITILHPEDFVNPENWQELANGVAQNVRRGKDEQVDDLLADFLITAKTAINLVKNGLREVSCGYEADYIQTSKGRGIQTNIVGNHIALVEEGRAGAAYAINDQKGKEPIMTLKDKIRKIFAKAQEEALAVATIDEAAEEEKKTAKDDAPPAPEQKGYSLDDVMKMLDGLKGLMSPQKDETTPPTPGKAGEAVDDGETSGLEDRIAKLEAAVNTILEKLSATGDEDKEDTEETGDEDSDEDGDDEETSDAEGCRMGDTAARIEILAPGMKAKGKDAKVQALKKAYATADGKAIIDQFTGGKSPDFKNQKFVDTLFVATSEILKQSRAGELADTRKQSKTKDNPAKGPMTAERLNDINAKHYAAASTVKH